MARKKKDNPNERFGDPDFWWGLGHHFPRAEAIAKCYPEYWLQREYCRRPAHYLADRALGILTEKPYDTWWGRLCSPDDPVSPPLPRYKPSRLPPTDPIHWVLRGRDRYQAAQKAIEEVRRRRRRAADLTPIDPEFWICVGLPKVRAKDIVKCFAEYWLSQGKRWTEAQRLAVVCLNRLTGATRVADDLVDQYGGRLYTCSLPTPPEPERGFFSTWLGKTPEDPRKSRRWNELIDPVESYSQAIRRNSLLSRWELGERYRKPVHHQSFQSHVMKVVGAAHIALPESWAKPWLKHRVLERLEGPTEVLPDGAFYVAGARLTDQITIQAGRQRWLQANSTAAAAVHSLQFGPSALYWPEDVRSNFCFGGTTRSGKTVLLRLLIQSIDQAHIVAYDDKTDLLSILHAIHPGLDIHIMNPMDRRSTRWDIAADVTTNLEASEISARLIEDDPRVNPHFTQVPQALTTAAMDALNYAAPGQWGLVHLLAALEAKNIEAVLSRYDSTREVFETHLNRPRDNPSDIQSSLDSKLMGLRPIAAAWMHADRALSIRTWAQSRSSIVLGNHERHKEAMGRINRLLFQLISESVLDKSTRSDRETWFILDELEQLGKLPLLGSLLNCGAGLGIRCALGFHDIETMQHYYGQATRGLIGMCCNYALLRINNPAAARWASDVIGSQEVVLVQDHKGEVGSRETTTESTMRIERPAVRPTEFQELPLTTAENGLTGYFKSPKMGTYRGHIPGDVLFRDMLTPPDADFKDFDPRPPEHFRFPEKTGELLAEFGFATVSRKSFPAASTDPQPARSPFNPDDFPRLDP